MVTLSQGRKPISLRSSSCLLYDSYHIIFEFYSEFLYTGQRSIGRKKQVKTVKRWSILCNIFMRTFFAFSNLKFLFSFFHLFLHLFYLIFLNKNQKNALNQIASCQQEKPSRVQLQGLRLQVVL